MMKAKAKKFVYYYEKFKTLLLIVLVMTCIIQVGILWSSQSGSIPIYFLSNIFSGSQNLTQTTIEDAKGEFLLPYRVYLTEGYDDDHFVIPNGSNDYKTLWNGAKLYVSEALDTKPKSVITYHENTWGNLVASKPYTFEFCTVVPIELIKWVLNLKASAGDGLTGIYKMVICPDDPDNNYADTVYIRDNDNIYIYQLPDFKGSALSASEFAEIKARQKAEEGSRNYQVAYERFRKANISISLDMMGPYSRGSNELYPDLDIVTYVNAAEQNYSYAELTQIGHDLFGADSIDYDPDEDKNGALVFKRAKSIYRLYRSSVLEYKFTDNLGISDVPDVVEAYKKAIDFIIDHSRQNDLLKNVSVYLKSVQKNQQIYTFNFDYSVVLEDGKGEVPILLKNYKTTKDGESVNNCISIEATSKRVVGCEWVALKMKTGKEIKNYNWIFADMHAKTYKSFPELSKQEISIKDFGIYYVLSNTNHKEEVLPPSFVLFTKDGNYSIKIQGN